MAITLGVDLGLFGAMLEDSSSPKSVTELSKMLRGSWSLGFVLLDVSQAKQAADKAQLVP